MKKQKISKAKAYKSISFNDLSERGYSDMPWDVEQEVFATGIFQESSKASEELVASDSELHNVYVQLRRSMTDLRKITDSAESIDASISKRLASLEQRLHKIDHVLIPRIETLDKSSIILSNGLEVFK